MPVPVKLVLLLAIGGGVLFDILVPGNAAGVNAVLVTGAFLGAALVAAGPAGLRRMDRADAWLAPAALAFAAFPSLRADDWLVSLDLLFAALLAAGFTACLAGGRITRGLVPRVLELSLGASLAAVIGGPMVVADGLRAGRRAREAEPGTRRGLRDRLGRAAPVVRGLLIAVPVAAVFVTLFAAADAVFARLASDLLAWDLDWDLEDLAGRAIVVSIVAWGAAGLLGLGGGLLPALATAGGGGLGRAAAPVPPGSTARGGTPASAARPSAPAAPDAAGARPAGPPPAPGAAPTAGPGAAPADPRGPVGPGAPGPVGVPRPGWPPASPAAAGAAPWPGAAAPWSAPGAAWSAAPSAPRPLPRLGTTEAATVLLVVDLLFLVFVALQVAYLFGGRDTMVLAGLTYSDYARKGFFELVLVAALAGGLVVSLDLAVARRSAVQLGAAVALLGLTAVVLASAFLRIRLYQEAYGWTELRLVVLTAIGWLAVALAVSGGLLATRRTPWVLHAMGILVLVTVGGLNLVGPQRVVTTQNLARAADPSLVPFGGRTGLDAYYLYELGDEAVAPIVEAWPRLDAATRADLSPVLADRADALATSPMLAGWPAWNLTREQARAALRDWSAAQGR